MTNDLVVACTLILALTLGAQARYMVTTTYASAGCAGSVAVIGTRTDACQLNRAQTTPQGGPRYSKLSCSPTACVEIVCIDPTCYVGCTNGLTYPLDVCLGNTKDVNTYPSSFTEPLGWVALTTANYEGPSCAGHADVGTTYFPSACALGGNWKLTCNATYWTEQKCSASSQPPCSNCSNFGIAIVANTGACTSTNSNLTSYKATCALSVGTPTPVPPPGSGVTTGQGSLAARAGAPAALLLLVAMAVVSAP